MMGVPGMRGFPVPDVERNAVHVIPLRLVKAECQDCAFAYNCGFRGRVVFLSQAMSQQRAKV